MPFRVVFDERCFEDTIIRVEKTPTHLYLADVWMFNGVPIFDSTTFDERQEKLKTIYDMFYTPCPEFETFCIKMRSELTDIRGKEYYSTEKGFRGIFVEDTATDHFEIVRTDIPDVYKISSNGEYLRVKTLALSKQLKTFGASFILKCTSNHDGTWTPILSSNTVTNEEDSSSRN
jgi:hypothetical protein